MNLSQMQKDADKYQSERYRGLKEVFPTIYVSGSNNLDDNEKLLIKYLDETINMWKQNYGWRE
jgi:hypothetical protein